jgi:hypothetical protein
LTTLFLDPNSANKYSCVDGEKVNIILSPSLYWVKKLPLPVNYIRDVKKLLPSIFEETLPVGNYSYSTYKSADEFVIFAYEDKLILDAISKSGISSANIANVYFAQSELESIEGAVKINETQSLYVKDGIVVLVPCCWIEESGDLDLSDIELSKHKIALQHYAHIVDNSSLYKIGAILLVLSVLIFAEYFITIQKTSETLALKDEIFTKYNLKQTTMQNKSMLKKYKNIHETQIKLREATSFLLSFRLQEKEQLKRINLKGTALNAEFNGASKAMLSRVEKSLNAKGFKFKTELKETTLHLEMAL